jgi:exodeoxyribonuclease VII large subunit
MVYYPAMARPAKSQWDFQDLFANVPVVKPEVKPAAGTTGIADKDLSASTVAEDESIKAGPANALPQAPSRRILSVTELTAQVRRLLESQLGFVWVSGEITNLRIQSSGHVYFTLKDSAAQIACVLFRGEYQVDRSLLEDGRKITVRGELTVYEQRGQYQLRVLGVELEGLGALQAAFEKLKQKLNAEGLFAQERKRPLPRFPQRIGLATSPTGAAIRDVLHVVERRNPSLEIILAPCRVQGQGAGDEVAVAIRLLNEFSRRGVPLDLILLTRGGGSLEDLWSFNEEVVARAIFNSAVPIVSAVGHEIDFTISDFVADVRAATPSAAAEIITEGVFASCRFLAEAGERLPALVRARIEDKRSELTQASQRLARVHPRRKVGDWLQRLDDLQSSLSRCARQSVRQHRISWRNLAERLGRVRPALVLKARRELLDQQVRRLHEQVRHRVREHRQRLNTVEARLRLLGPEHVLGRGYSITTDAESGKVLRAAEEAKAGTLVRTRLQRGEISSRVEPK